jgi:hypothetical protein
VCSRAHGRFGFAPAFGIAAGLSAFSIPYFVWAEKRFLERKPEAAAIGSNPTFL